MSRRWRCLIAGLASVMTCVWATVATAESTLDVVKHRGKLVVGVRYDSAPYGYVNEHGEVVGLDIDIAKYIASKLGVPIELVQVTGQNRIPTLLSGRVDMLAASVTIFRNRIAVVDFTVPYFLDGVKVLVRKGSPIRGFGDLGGKRVATIQGTAYEKQIKAAHPTAQVLAYQEYPQARLALKQGLADALVSTAVILAGLAYGDPSLEIVGDFVSWELIALALRKDDSKWRDFLNFTIQDMWKEGKYQEAYNKYFGLGSRYPLPLTFKMEVWPD